jgi:hypothetical protein
MWLETKDAPKVGRLFLETLPDENHLKPVMWANTKRNQSALVSPLGSDPLHDRYSLLLS